MTTKEETIRQIFDSIAPNYDFVNSLISFGRHHYWRKFTVAKAEVPLNGIVLDVCCGTGMITRDLALKAGPKGKVIGIDISANMLEIAREDTSNFKLKDNIEFHHANAMQIPFPDNTFDCVTIGYGLRNSTNPKQVLEEIKRVTKLNGRFVSLEMVKPSLPLFKQLYNFYLNNWVPLVGKIAGKNRNAYQYLHDSIVSFICQNELTQVFREIGFENIKCYELTWGIVAVHAGFKPLNNKNT